MLDSDPTRAIRLLLNVAEACKALGGICPKTLYNVTAPRGTLRSVKLLGRRMYDIKDLQRWIDAQKRKEADDE